MTILAQDNFDADTVGAIAPGWVNRIGTWTVVTRNPVSGANTFGASNDADAVLYTALAARADMKVKTEQKLVAGGGAAPDSICHILRSDAAYNNCYIPLFTTSQSTGTVDISLYKRISGAASLVAAFTGVAFAHSAGDILSLTSQIAGATISVFASVNGAAYGSALATFSDTSVVSAGYPGLYYAKTGPSPTAQLAIDNFVYDDAASASTNNALTNATGSVLFSPYNWDIQSSTAKSINAGAYLKTIFGGTTCTLTFDMTGIQSPVPQLSYRVDGFGTWYNVPLSASIAITIPADTVDYASKPGHLLELRIKSTAQGVPRWSTQAAAVKLTGILLDTGKSISAPPALPLKAIFYGDSITEGIRTVNGTASTETDMCDSGQCWSMEVARILGAEAGNVGFGGSGWITAGGGGVPALTSTYNFLYSGVSRSFAVQPDFIFILDGANEGGDVTAATTAVLNGLLALTTTTKMIVARPLDGSIAGGGTTHASQLQAGIAASNSPSRCSYVNTAGFFTVANSSDNVHPYGVENLTHIAPLVANAIRPILAAAPAPALVARTVSGTLATGKNADNTLIPAANVTCAVSFWDESTNNTLTTPRYQSAALATNASGAWSFVAQSTLAAGGTGYVDIKAPGLHYNGPVAVA